jgi:hypothetical protein
MPVVRFYRSSPLPDGSLVPASGRLRFRPSTARTIDGAPDNVVTPVPFNVALIAGAADVTLAPTAAGWAWRVDESVDGIRDESYFVLVPDVAGPVDDADLVRVNPGTLAPQAAPEAAWWAEVQRLEAATSGGFAVDPTDADVLLITTRTDGSIAVDPGDADVLLIAT